MSIFEMASQVEKISYEKAVLLYNLGFSVQIRIIADKIEKTLLLEENSIESRSFDDQLERAGVLDSDGRIAVPIAYYAELSLLNHAGLHLEYEDGRHNSIEYGKFDWLLSSLIELQKTEKITHYVKNNTIFVTVKK